MNRNTAKELAKKGGDVAAESVKDAKRLAQDISTEVGGSGKAIMHEGHELKGGGQGSPHAHPVGPDGKPYKSGDTDGPHVFFDNIKKQGILMFIFDSNQDGKITYKDVGEWLNPLPFEMPAAQMDYGGYSGGRPNDWT